MVFLLLDLDGNLINQVRGGGDPRDIAYRQTIEFITESPPRVVVTYRAIDSSISTFALFLNFNNNYID